ncbi:uncharacterized protein BDW47DRAFT_103143, partial [Aspergillus candidus]
MQALWTQRSSVTRSDANIVAIVFNLPENTAGAPKFHLEPMKLTIRFHTRDSSSAEKDHLYKIEFWEEVDVDNSKRSNDSSKRVTFILRKKQRKLRYWPRLTKEEKPPFPIKKNMEHVSFPPSVPSFFNGRCI